MIAMFILALVVLIAGAVTLFIVGALMFRTWFAADARDDEADSNWLAEHAEWPPITPERWS